MVVAMLRHLVLCQLAVAILVQFAEHLVAGGSEFRRRDLAVAVGVHALQETTMLLGLARAVVLRLLRAVRWLVHTLMPSLARFVDLALIDEAVAVGIELVEESGAAGGEFFLAHEAVAVLVEAFEHAVALVGQRDATERAEAKARGNDEC